MCDQFGGGLVMARFTALVTGGNRGIGLKTAELLAREGITTVITARNAKEGSQAISDIQNEGLPIHCVALDVADPEAIAETVAIVCRDFGPIGVLINNAGVLFQDRLLSGDLENWQTSWQVHVNGPLYLIRAVVPQMRRLNYGRIVNVSSGWGSFHEGLGPAYYGITKAALNALTVKAAEELPDSIKINAVCPGWVRTRMGGDGATRSVDEGAQSVLWAALLKEDGPTGGFFRDGNPIPW
jgi:NAD(P)-dependent dehydrogenase (short-subunit alcohol dehydrogenase family)